MKKKGIIVAMFFAVIMVTSLAAGVLVQKSPQNSAQNNDVTVTGTPADNFPDAQREQFCGSGDAKETTFVKEYAIPTVCTDPLAITTDIDGNVWFAETNTGGVTKFDPKSDSFKEYKNPSWPKKGRSMMWGMDAAPDGSIWYTDETYDSIWRFDPVTEKYKRLAYPSEGDALPQKLQVFGSQIIVNDFTGNKLTIFDASQSDESASYISLPSPVDKSYTADFAVDPNNYLWYTNWIFQQGGVLIKFDQEAYRSAIGNQINSTLPFSDYIDVFPLAADMITPNGMTITDDGKIWMADTSTSNFYSYDPTQEKYTKYRTSDPPISTYGNASGIIITPISRPYWMDSDQTGKVVFNEQTGNKIGVMDPKSESLVEYFVPSMNPAWSDCGDMTDCGVAQVFDFALDGNKIWFTEWVENHIGVIDTSVALPFDIQLDSNTISLKPGQSKEISFAVSPTSTQDLSNVSLVLLGSEEFLNLDTDSSTNFQLASGEPQKITASISASDNATSGSYKVLVGSETDEVTVSKFLTVVIEP